MERLVSEITAIKITLERLEIQPTEQNMEKLLGCQQHLSMIRDEIAKIPEPVKEEPNGNADTE